MSTENEAYDPHNLDHVVGDDGEVVRLAAGEALIRWTDGCETLLTYRSDGWAFPEERHPFPERV